MWLDSVYFFNLELNAVVLCFVFLGPKSVFFKQYLVFLNVIWLISYIFFDEIK